MGIGSTPTPLAPPEQAPINHFGRAFGALFNPMTTFEDVARRPSWIVPVILLTVISLATIAVFSQRVGWERVVKQQVERSPRAAERMAAMKPEQRQQAIEQSVKLYQIIGYVAAAIEFFIIVVVLALALMGAVNLFCGASVRYITSMAVVAHAYMPSLVSGLLAIVILFLKNPDTVDVEHIVASNLGALVGSDWPRWLVSLASSVDLFAFWRIALLAIGFSAASPKKVTVGKALGIILVVYAVYALAAAGLAAVLS